MQNLSRLGLALALSSASFAAAAHTGHDSTGLLAGLGHPFGLDHLLAMVAVGLWSAVALPAGRRWAGPAVFMLGLLAGALAGLFGVATPLAEAGIAASVVLFAAMLLAPRALPLAQGLGLLAAAASLHGLAHGAALPAGASFAGYAAGFLLTTAALHGAGLGLGRTLASAQAWAWRAVAAGLGGAGLLLLTQV